MIRVKVCGITSVDDARVALEAGADAIGLNFVSGSPRAVELPTACAISAVAAGRAVRVGVFRDAPFDFIMAVAEEAGLDAVQLHGDEKPALAARLPFPVIKALAADGRVADRARDYPGVDLLLDHPGGGGGLGRDWPFARARPLGAAGRRVWLAGGLTPENVAAAVREARPHGVDAASGLESAPGRKDADRVREFVRAARGARAPG